MILNIKFKLKSDESIWLITFFVCYLFEKNLNPIATADAAHIIARIFFVSFIPSETDEGEWV